MNAPLAPVLCLLAAAPAAAAPATDARALMERVTEDVRYEGAEMATTLSIWNAAGQVRVRRMVTALRRDKDGTARTLLRFLEPADVKGTGLLTFDYVDRDDDMWLFLPALRKTRRLVSSDQGQSFMGSEFSYSDMSPPPLSEATYEARADETVDGVACRVVEAKAASGAIAEKTGYSRRVVFAGKDDFVPRRVEFYDRDGALAKVLTATDVRKTDPARGRYRSFRMVMENKQNGRRSEMVIEKFQLNAKLPDELFTTRYLERL